MADVVKVGFTQPTYIASGYGTVAWPPGTLPGHLAVVDIQGTEASTRRPVGTGWVNFKHTETTDHYSKRLTAADIASPLEVWGYVGHLSVYSNAGRVGNVTFLGDDVTPGVKLSVAGAGLHAFGVGYSNLTPSAGKNGTDVICIAYKKRRSATWWRAGTVVGYRKLDGAFNGVRSIGVEIMPFAAPSSPTLVTAGQVDVAAPVVLSWVHRSSEGADQESAVVRARTVGATVWQYVQADMTLGSSPVQLAQSAQSVAVTLTAGPWEWSAQTSDNGLWSAFATPSVLDVAPKPTVTSVAVTTALGDMSPTITATATTQGALVAMRVWLVPDGSGIASALRDSGVLSGPGLTWTAPAGDDWTNGQVLRAWVSVRQEGGLWSDPTQDDATFAVTWTPPAAPTAVTVDNGTPLQVSVTGAASVVQMQSQVAGEWGDISTLDSATATLTVTRPQRYGVPVTFRARNAGLVEGVTVWSAWVESATVTPVDQNSYFEADGSVLKVWLRTDDVRKRVQDVQVSETFGGIAVDRTPPKGWSGSTMVSARTLAERDELIAWLDAHPVWTIWWPPDGGISDAPTTVTLSDPLAVGRFIQGNSQLREIPLSWVTQ